MALSTRHASFASSTPKAKQQVEISRSRFEELLRADVINFAEAYRDITFSQGLQNILVMQQNKRIDNARKLSVEISSHFAFRVDLLNKFHLHNDCFQQLRQIYHDSFAHMLTQIPHIPEEKDLEVFDEVMLDVRTRHLNVVPLLVSSITDEPDSDELRSFLRKFFHSRIYTEMLTRQYFAAGATQPHHDLFPPQSPLGGGYQSGIACDALVCEVVGAAFKRAVLHTGRHYAEDGNVSFELEGDVTRAKTLGEYVYYIAFELAKNAFLATYQQDTASRRPVVITISENEKLIFVRVRDYGQGILTEQARQDIGRFGFTTAELQIASDGSLHKHNIPPEYKRSPIAGVGCGFPLARKYAQFIGGSIELLSVPRYGADVYWTFQKDITSTAV